MTGDAEKRPVQRARVSRDLRTAVAAILLLAMCGGIWLWMSVSAGERREKVLATVPAFPARGQERAPQRGRRNDVPLQRDLPVESAPAGPQPARADPITSFVLKPAPYVALVHVNALFNTPLFGRIKKCVPTEWREITQGMAELGIDVEHDVDRLAMMRDGMALSGFFSDKPIARNIAAQWSEIEERSYRGYTLWLSQNVGVAQVGNLLVFGPRDSIESLLDRAIDPAPTGADPQDVYGDVFVRTDLSGFAGNGARDERGAAPEAMRALLDGLSGVVVRANVWDQVALSVEAKPQAGRDVGELARMARGAIALAKEQLDPTDVELMTLASMAKVGDSAEALQIDLALPASDLFDKLHFPCPGTQAPAPRASGDAR